MDPLTLGLLLGGAGLLKSEVVDRPKERRQRKLAAETQRYSPWTGLRAGEIQEADPFGSTLQFGLTGASLGQSVAAQEQAKQMADLQKKLLEGQLKSQNFGGVPWSGLRSNADLYSGVA